MTRITVADILPNLLISNYILLFGKNELMRDGYRSELRFYRSMLIYTGLCCSLVIYWMVLRLPEFSQDSIIQKG